MKNDHFFQKKLYLAYQGFIVYTLLVILWGAWVRISHSGDGCGESWPLCHGEIIPIIKSSSSKTWIEFTHRFMSGIYGILMLILIWITRQKVRFTNPQAYFWSKMALFFTVTEALLGAKLVLFGLVGSNDSLWRVIIMGLHLTNSMMLVFALTKTVLNGSFFINQPYNIDQTSNIQNTPAKANNNILLFFKIGLIGLFLIAITGVIAALSNTLFPSQNFWEALIKDLDPQSHYLIRLRGLHPLLGTFIGIGLAVGSFMLSDSCKDMILKKILNRLGLLLILVPLIGFSMIILKSSIWLKLTHLLFIYLLWIQLIMAHHRYLILKR